ncbi:hypothetical protein R1flu_005213 [Riccia fluitans]|uniref:Uncharacterized protein n=1 Tax=Riccia fluitans TaxID=41844 RepID=A0ABD1YTH2_9MARC
MAVCTGGRWRRRTGYDSSNGKVEVLTDWNPAALNCCPHPEHPSHPAASAPGPGGRSLPGAALPVRHTYPGEFGGPEMQSLSWILGPPL